MKAIPKSSDRKMQNGNIVVYKRDIENQQEKKIPSKIKCILIFIIIFLILFIIIAVITIFYLLKLKNSNNEKEINEGYFYPSDDPNNLHKCNLENCKECQGTKDNNECISCKEDYSPSYDENNNIISCKKLNIKQGKCQIGTEEKCLTCDYSNGECATCNNGYFIPTDETIKTKCQKCSIKNCKSCSGTKTNDVCHACEDYSNPITENNKIKKCSIEEGEGSKCLTVDNEKNECKSCNVGYKFENGKCILNYHFKATFITKLSNENIKLAEQFFSNIKEMIVDANKLNSPVKEYTFSEKGEHIVYFKIKMPKSLSLSGIFEGIKKMSSISFSELFNTEKIQSMDRMFYNCQKLTKVDFTNIKTDNVISMNYMFYQCISLTSIDFSKLNTQLVTDTSYMFTNCISLKSLDLSSFKTQKLQYMNNMFEGCTSLTSINISKLNFKTNEVEDMSYLFKGCNSLTSVDLSGFITEKVQDVSEMFRECVSLTSIDISNFNLPNVKNLNYMFMDCINLKYINMALLNNNLMGTFNNISSSGTIKVNNNVKSEISNALEGWNIITE